MHQLRGSHMTLGSKPILGATLLRPVYGRFFYPGFPSCGRAGPGVEPGTFRLEIRWFKNQEKQ